MKSIMQEKDGTCYLCKRINQDFNPKYTHEHHAIFGSANRKLSEKYGLKVYVCPEHHEYGDLSAHRNAEIALIIKKEAQKAFEKKYPNLSFREIFGKNYLDDEDRKIKGQQDTELGFIPIEDGIEEMEW